jgi:ubiquinone/menaquinone biosynthesis C-methylase UbiE
MKLYDKINKRLIMLKQKADSKYWDKHWQTESLVEKVKAGANNRLVKKFTTKFLKPGAKILEGGCGIGQNVYGLKSWGYEAFGVDFAPKAIKKVKTKFPDLNISVQDVRKLNFPDNFFDGYWSLGVIEHFSEGYDKILEEAERVIRPGGFLFLTFPHLSPLRKLKINLGLYKSLEGIVDEKEFYQFILDSEEVKANVERYGFRMILKCPYDATKGIKDEITLLKPILQKIYDSQNILAKGVRFLISLLFSKIASHSILLVFQKNENQIL